MTDPLRVCRTCGLKAHNHEDLKSFAKGKSSKYGRQNACKSCLAKKSRRYYLENREKVNKAQLKYLRKYRKARPLKYVLTHIKVKSKKKGLDFDLDFEYLTQLWEDCKGKCPMTEVSMSLENSGYNNPYSMSVDRIIPERGYVKENVRLVCLWYNRTRSNWGDQFVIEMCQNLINQKTNKLIKE
jgi:hypothetical protein